MPAPAELDASMALRLLAARGIVGASAEARVLGGGVSNIVVLVEDGSTRIVVKQSLPQLRVRDRWLADRSRIVREWQAMGELCRVLPLGRLPALQFLDAGKFLYAMEAAGPGTADWKSHLLAGRCDPAIARSAGATLGLMVRETWRDPRFASRFGDQQAFWQLRTDPYYRTIARRHPNISGAVEEWIEECSSRRVAMVHGDWSPKNLLVDGRDIVCIDFECAHFGDPSYDAGFLLNHLILKSFHRPGSAAAYLDLARSALCWTLAMLPAQALPWFERAAMRHLALLMLARVDGKSPVEYLHRTETRAAVRGLALRLIAERPPTLRAVLSRVTAATGRP